MTAACSYCGRKGILIYPVRYAIACPNGKDDVPGLSGNFKIVGGPADISPAKYTLRALRTGYLYTYEEKRNRLKAYIVLSNGALWEFPVEYIPTVDPHRMDGCCLDQVKISLSQCIDIEPFPCEMLGNIWLGWSNVIWTKATIDNLRNVNWRRKHMQCIDGQSMLTGTALHSDKFKNGHKNISHFFSNDSELEKAFGFSNVPATRDASIRKKFDALKRVLEERCTYGGFVVALNDPVGITNDFSELTFPTHHAGFNEDIYRGQICTQLIGSVEQMVREEACVDTEREIILEKAAEIDPEVIQGKAIGSMWKMFKAGGPKRYLEQERADDKKYGNSMEGKMVAAQDRAWKEMTTSAEGKDLIDFARIDTFSKKQIDTVKEYEPIGLKLADLHCSWLTSMQLSEWMEGTHDTGDIRSGYAFRESLAQCIGKAIATARCQVTLEHWMTVGKLSDTKNLYARALLFNQKDILDAAETDIRGADFKPKYLLSIYKGALGRVLKNQAEQLVDRLALTTANFLACALGQATNIVMRNLAIASLTLQAQTYISASNLTRKELSNWIIETAHNSGVRLDKDFSARRKAAGKEVKRLMPKYRMGPVACAFEFDLNQLKKEGRISPGIVKAVGIPGQDLIKRWLGSSADFNTGVVGVILQIVAVYFASEDVSRSDKFDSAKYDIKLGISIVSLCATLVECVTSTLDKAAEHPLSKTLFAQWAIKKGIVGKTLQVAKFIGASAGVVNAACDLWSAWSAIDEGELVLGGTYAVSALLSAYLAYIGYSLGSAIFWPLFVAAFVLGMIIGILRPAPLKKWLSRCYFSADFSSKEVKRYATLDEELEAFCDAARG